MRIWHRLTFSDRNGVERNLREWGIVYKKSPLPGGGFLIHIDTEESDARWRKLSALAQAKDAVDLFDTDFTADEIRAARWVRLIPTFEQGYPQPHEQMVWRRLTYEDQCPQCGVGYRQRAPFRISSEPRLGKHDFVCLHWTYSIFCTMRVLAALQLNSLRGYRVWEAIIDSTQQPSKLVSQLVFPIVTEPGLVDIDQLDSETCPECKITKYGYHKRGYMRIKRESLESDSDIMQTHEWFGSGGYGGFREILISNRLARLILEERWIGVRLKPIALAQN